MDMQAVAAMMYGLGTAYVAIQLKDLISGRERSEQERALDAFGYNNISSWVPMIADPMLTALGLDGARINPYGPHASLVPPVVTQLDNLMRAPGAIPRMLTGHADYSDRQAFKALPFMGTYFLSRIVDAAGKKAPVPVKPSSSARPRTTFSGSTAEDLLEHLKEQAE